MPHSIVRVGTRFWMLYTLRAASLNTICLAYRDDDFDGAFTDYGSNRVLTLGSQGWENGTNGNNGAWLLEHEGLFYIFYASATGSGTPGIGYATASAITGPYTKYASNPILSPGGSGTWDERRAQEPSVIVVDGTWVLAYMGRTPRIRRASRRSSALPLLQTQRVLDESCGQPAGWIRHVGGLR